jgi:methylisocitrate lyase
VQIEDQESPKRCPALDGRSVVGLEEQLVRLGAALAARRDPDFLIIARSDADVIGYDELVLRCNRYLEAGADVAMPICFTVDGRPLSALTPDDQMEVYARLARDIDGPVKGVLIPDGYTAADMADAGYRLLGLTGGPIEAAVNGLLGALSELHRTGTEAAWRALHPPAVSAPRGIMQLLGLDADLAFEARFKDGKA